MKIASVYSISLFLIFLLLSSFIPNRELPGDKEKFVVVLDAGHGGHDPGNLGNGYLEKNIALGIVLATGKVLENAEDIEVVYTRKDDRFVDLYVRGEIANKAKADLFVSIHCDSHNSDANGAGTFVLGLHANKQNFEIAKKENSVIYLEDNYESRYAAYDINSPESIIGLTIMQEEFLEQSILLAKMMQDNFTKELKRKDRKVKQAGFIVLHQTFMPSVLVECGFLTNKNEGSYLNSKKGQSEMGQAIADAIVLYKNNLWSTSAAIAAEGEAVITSVPQVDKPVEKAVEEVKEEPIDADKKETVAQTEKDAVAEAKNPADNISANVAADPSKEVAAAAAVGITAVDKELKTPQTTEELSAEQPATDVAETIANPTSPKTEEQEVVNPANETPAIAITEKSEEKPAEPKTEQPKVDKETVAKETEAAKKPEEVSAGETPESKKSHIVFKVQILASSKQIPLRSENFNGLSTISKEPYKNLFRYMYGRTDSYKQAKLLKSNADLKGYTTSFIVAYKEGVRIPVREAMKYVSE